MCNNERLFFKLWMKGLHKKNQKKNKMVEIPVLILVRQNPLYIRYLDVVLWLIFNIYLNSYDNHQC